MANQRPRELIAALVAIIFITLVYLSMNVILGEAPAASSFYGHGMGVVGFLLMLMTETLYSLRKRTRLARWGKMSSWLQFHIFTGIVGPYLVLLHTSWVFNGVAGVLALMTGVIVLSGFIGRYIYTSVPRTADGLVVEAAEIDREIDRLDARLREWDAVHASPYAAHASLKAAQTSLEAARTSSEPVIAAAQASPEFALDSAHVSPEFALASAQAIPEPAMASALGSPQTADYIGIAQEMDRQPVDTPMGFMGESAGHHLGQKHEARELKLLQHRRETLSRQAASLQTARKLLATWHAIHIPIGLGLFSLALVHIVAAIYYAELLR